MSLYDPSGLEFAGDLEGFTPSCGCYYAFWRKTKKNDTPNNRRPSCLEA